MSIPLDLLIDFKGNEFEFSNAVTAQSLRIYQKNKVINQQEDEDAEEILPRAALKLTSEAFEDVLKKKVSYHRQTDEDV